MNSSPGTSGPHRRHFPSCPFPKVAHCTAHTALHISVLARHLAHQPTWYTRVPPSFCEAAWYSTVGTGRGLPRQFPSKGQQVVSKLVTNQQFAVLHLSPLLILPHYLTFSGIRARVKGFHCLCPLGRSRSPQRGMQPSPRASWSPQQTPLVPPAPRCASKPLQKSKLQIWVCLEDTHL